MQCNTNTGYYELLCYTWASLSFEQIQGTWLSPRETIDLGVGMLVRKVYHLLVTGGTEMSHNLLVWHNIVKQKFLFLLILFK